MLFKLILVCLVLGFVRCLEIDNGVIDEPSIDCASDSINVNFNTKNAFEGRVYIKGHIDEEGCKVGPDNAVNPGNQTDLKSFGITVPFARCGVSRRRSLNPVGIYVSTVVVITFHPQFLTKIDRAYEIRCFYMAADKTVSAEVGVSELTTALVTNNLPMPVCRYEVLDSPTGNPVKFANIGDTVHHKWTCESQTTDIFCVLIHSCFVDDGKNNRATLLDESGCAQDRYLLQNLEYPSDLMATREAQVFKYADRPQLFFQCQISILLKEGNVCNRPKCQEPARGRKRRDVFDDEFSLRPTLDVASETINVLDIDDDVETSPPSNDWRSAPGLQQQQDRQRYTQVSRRGGNSGYSKAVPVDQGRVCMSSAGFTAVVSTTVFVCVITMIISVAVFYRRRHTVVNNKPTLDLVYGQ